MAKGARHRQEQNGRPAEHHKVRIHLRVKEVDSSLTQHWTHKVRLSGSIRPCLLHYNCSYLCRLSKRMSVRNLSLLLSPNVYVYSGSVDPQKYCALRICIFLFECAGGQQSRQAYRDLPGHWRSVYPHRFPILIVPAINVLSTYRCFITWIVICRLAAVAGNPSAGLKPYGWLRPCKSKYQT